MLQQHDILYSYFKSARSIVKTITRGAMDDLMHIARGQRLSAIVHQVVHGTEVKYFDYTTYMHEITV